MWNRRWCGSAQVPTRCCRFSLVVSPDCGPLAFPSKHGGARRALQIAGERPTLTEHLRSGIDSASTFLSDTRRCSIWCESVVRRGPTSSRRGSACPLSLLRSVKDEVASATRCPASRSWRCRARPLGPWDRTGVLRRAAHWGKRSRNKPTQKAHTSGVRRPVTRSPYLGNLGPLYIRKPVRRSSAVSLSLSKQSSSIHS